MKTREEIQWEQRCQDIMERIIEKDWIDGNPTAGPRMQHLYSIEEKDVRLDWNWCLIEISGFWTFGDMWPHLRPDPDDPEQQDSHWDDIVSSFKSEVWNKHASGSPEKGLLHTNHLAQWMKKNLHRQWKWNGEE